MTSTFRPRLDILPLPQRLLWAELEALPRTFTLYGGTAIALYLGHRESIDFDFFSSVRFDPRQLLDDLPLLRGAVVTQVEPDTLSVIVDRQGPVRLSFFGVPKLGRVREPARTDDNAILVADLLDLAGTKASVIQVRAEPKDYIDIDALLASGIDLPHILSAGLAIYGLTFTPQSALKALAYFDDPLLSVLSSVLKDRLSAAVKAVNLDALPDLRPISPRSPDVR